jgi:hypothetical protein
MLVSRQLLSPSLIILALFFLHWPPTLDISVHRPEDSYPVYSSLSSPHFIRQNRCLSLSKLPSAKTVHRVLTD